MKPLDELRGVERATVLKAGIRAGSLLRRADSVEFAYDRDYVDREGGAVATTLTVSLSPVVTHAPGALQHQLLFFRRRRRRCGDQ